MSEELNENSLLQEEMDRQNERLNDIINGKLDVEFAAMRAERQKENEQQREALKEIMAQFSNPPSGSGVVTSSLSPHLPPVSLQTEK